MGFLSMGLKIQTAASCQKRGQKKTCGKEQRDGVLWFWAVDVCVTLRVTSRCWSGEDEDLGSGGGHRSNRYCSPLSLADRAWSRDCCSQRCSSPTPNPPGRVSALPEAFGSSTLMLCRARGLEIKRVSGNPYSC